MVDRYIDPVPAILMADRGCESFDVFAHLIRKGVKSLITIIPFEADMRSAFF